MSDLPRWYALEAEQLKAEIERLRAGLQLIANDKHRLMNEVARQTAASILGGKPIGEVTEWPYAQAMCREDLPNAEIVALRVKLYNVERDLEDSEADNKRLREFIEGLPDGDEIVRLRGLLTRIHGIAAEPRPVNTEVRLENIACIASGERDATSAQLAEAQRFPHGAAAVTGCDMKINDEGRSNAAHWYERAMKAEARLQKIMARCADLLDEDQFNELDAIARTADSGSGGEK